MDVQFTAIVLLSPRGPRGVLTVRPLRESRADTCA